MELNPTHRGALVARSQCRLKLGDGTAALEDAQTAFDSKNLFITGLYQFAESLFCLGNFEKALIAFHRGHQLRRDMEGFRIGIQKCTDAIIRAIGDKAATQIEDFYDILPLVEQVEALKNGMNQIRTRIYSNEV